MEIDTAFSTSNYPMNLQRKSSLAYPERPSTSPFLLSEPKQIIKEKSPSTPKYSPFQRKGSRKLSMRKKKNDDSQPYNFRKASIRRQASIKK